MFVDINDKPIMQLDIEEFIVGNNILKDEEEYFYFTKSYDVFLVFVPLWISHNFNF